MPSQLLPHPVFTPQSTPDPHGEPEDRERSAGPKSVPLSLHNPVTQQMVVVGKRREAAEALLAERLRDDRTAHP